MIACSQWQVVFRMRNRKEIMSCIPEVLPKACLGSAWQKQPKYVLCKLLHVLNMRKLVRKASQLLSASHMAPRTIRHTVEAAYIWNF